MTRMLLPLLLAAAACGTATSAVPIAPAPAATPASPAEAEVRATLDRMFHAMRTGDSTALRTVLHPAARLLTTAERVGAPVAQEVPIDRFVAAVGAPHPQVWDERIANVHIRVDDHLAAAWMDYSFFLGDTFSHCGVNAVQLVRGAAGWQIVQITDTRRQDRCGVAG